MKSKTTDWEILQKEMENLAKGEWGVHICRRGRKWTPLMDIYETEKQVVLRLEVGGLKEDQFEVTLEEDTLIISGHRPTSAAGCSVIYHHVEMPNGAFERRIQINFPIKRESISANYNDGILEIVLPKENAKVSTRILVKEI